MKKNNKNIFLISFAAIALFSLSLFIAAVSAGNVVASGDESTEYTEDCAALPREARVNILVGGTDRVSGLTDVLMLASIDREGGKVTVMQIPRDTYAKYTDKSYKKINGAYGNLGGAEKLRELVSESMGVNIDKHIILSPDALRGVIDALGGVEVNIREPMYYRDPSQGLRISLKAGKQTLDGKSAEQFIRYRSGYADGDLGRIDTQKVFLCALAKKAREDMTPTKLAGLLSALLGKTDTDITLADAKELSDVLLGVKDENMFFLTAPGAPAIAEKSGASYYVLSRDATAEVLRNNFGAEGEFDKNNIFLNSDYSEFRDIYFGYSEYRVVSAADISRDTDGIAGIN